ncbi:MAG: bifunctional phosphoglucose/phosphomannose isomerase [Candidatus Saccharimonadales bacterium]
MLDDLAYIHERDVDDALGMVGKQSQQLIQDFNLANVSFNEVENIVYAGMGGSALAALVAQSFPDITVPFTIVRNYDLPSYVGPKTLLICASYSGNTEETLEALRQGREKQAQIAVICGGGKLKEAAEANSYSLLLLPKTVQPRYAVLSNYVALLHVLAKASVIGQSDIFTELQKAATFISEATKAWLGEVPTSSNPAKQLAQELMGKSVVIYSGPKLSPAAYKWKISVNENAKQIAWVNQYPEFNHNEFIGWSKQPIDKPYAVIDLRSSLEHPRVQKRFEVSARLLSGLRPEPHIVDVEGTTLLEQLLWASVFGDFVTIYLALLNGINPAPVDLVEKFKKALEE